MKALAAICLPTILAAQVPTGSDLVTRVMSTEQRYQRELGEFTFEYENSLKQFNANGVLVREDRESGELYMSHKRNVNIALRKNGKDLKPKDLEKAREAAAAKLEADARERMATGAAPRIRDGPWPGMVFGSTRMSAVDVLRYCELGEPLESAGILKVTFDQCRSPWPDESHFHAIRGIVRIDPQTYAVDSWQAWIKDGPGHGNLLFEASTQIAAGGNRVPRRLRMNLAAAPNLFPKARLDWTMDWRNPQRFQVKVDQEISEPPPIPPAGIK